MKSVGLLGPEWISFAITPAMNPIMIVHRILIRSFTVRFGAGRMLHA
jgi:hypothetical protein